MKSSELKGFLTGLLIGDGNIDKGVTKRAFSIKSTDKNFIDLIESEIKTCTPFHIKINFTPAHFSAGCNHKDSWELRIIAHPYFAKLYHRFYDDYRHRRITKYISEMLTPYGVAMWYMSDGYCCLVGKEKGNIYNRRVDFATDRYTYEEVVYLQNVMLQKFSIECSVIKRNNFYRLRVRQKSYESFIWLICPYMISSMLYKIYLGYTHQPVWMSDNLWNLQCSIRSATALTGKAEGKEIV